MRFEEFDKIRKRHHFFGRSAERGLKFQTFAACQSIWTQEVSKEASIQQIH